MKKSIRFLFLMLLSIWTTLSFAQGTRSISGIVRDNTGNGVSGISVTVKGTRLGTSTDINGSYRLTAVPENGAVLSFSGVGYEPQDVVVGETNTINIVLTGTSN